MLYGYARVSTAGQASGGNGLEAQETALRLAGAEVVYKDICTGTKSERPHLSALMGVLEAGDVMVITKLDRIARSVKEGLELIESLTAQGVRVNVLNMGILDSSPTGRLIRNIFLAFAEFERDMIAARTQEGKAIARQKPGFRDGRPKKFTEAHLRHAVNLLETHSYKQTESMTGISKSTLQRAKRKQTPGSDD